MDKNSNDFPLLAEKNKIQFLEIFYFFSND